MVVPEHLSFQWLAELFHKFNALFTLLPPDRVRSLGGAEAMIEHLFEQGHRRLAIVTGPV